AFVGGDDLEHLAAYQGGQGFLGPQDGQGTFEPLGVDFQIERYGIAHACLPSLGAQRRPSTQPCTPASACGSAAGSEPPAMAMSGRPPPLPPTCWATKLTSSPALTLPEA